MFSGTTVRAICIVWVSSHSFRVGIVHRLFFYIPYSIRNVLKFLRTFLKWINRLGNQISRFIRFCFQEQHLRSFSLFGSVLTHPELESYIIVFFFLVPYSLRNVLTKFDIFSQLAQPVEKLNQPFHQVFF